MMASEKRAALCFDGLFWLSAEKNLPAADSHFMTDCKFLSYAVCVCLFRELVGQKQKFGTQSQKRAVYF